MQILKDHMLRLKKQQKTFKTMHKKNCSILGENAANLLQDCGPKMQQQPRKQQGGHAGNEDEREFFHVFVKSPSDLFRSLAARPVHVTSGYENYTPPRRGAGPSRALEL